MVELVVGAVDVKQHTTKFYDTGRLILYVLEWSEIALFKYISCQRRSLAASFHGRKFFVSAFKLIECASVKSIHFREYRDNRDLDKNQ